MARLTALRAEMVDLDPILKIGSQTALWADVDNFAPKGALEKVFFKHF